MPVFDVHSYLGGSVIPGVATNAATITAAMKERGIDEAVLLSAHARSIDPMSGNRMLKAMTEQAPNLYGCLVAHVNRVDSSVNAMRELMNGRKMVAMVVVGNRPDEPVDKLVADPILNAYRRYGKPLYLFTPNAAAVSAALDIAKTYTAIKVVMLGMGGRDWRTAIIAAHTATNVFLETSGPLDRAKVAAAVEVIGIHRIVFGSSTPRVDAAAALGLIEDSTLSDEARRRILSANARKLFGLDQE